MNALERMFGGAMPDANRIVLLDSRKPLPTSFRSNYPVPLSVEVVDLLRFLKTQHNIKVNERLEQVVRKEAIRMAQEYNKNLINRVDSQPRSSQ